MGAKKWSKKDLDFFKNLINDKFQEVQLDFDESKKRADDIKTSTQ